MANWLLLPGFGGKYTSPSYDLNSTVDDETIDCSRCASLAVQVIHDSGTPAGTVQLEQSLDGSHWASFGDTINVASNGQMARIAIDDAPIGVIRINPASISAGAVHFILVGHEMPVIA